MDRKFDVDKIGLDITGIHFWSESGINMGGVQICWTSKTGQGEIAIVKMHNGKVLAQTYGIDSKEDKSFTKKLLELLLEKLEVVN